MGLQNHYCGACDQVPERFRRANVSDPIDRSQWRWTVDTPEDFRLAQALHARAPAGFHYAELIAIMESDPHLAEINAAIAQKVV